MTIWPKWGEDRVYAVAILVLVVSAILYLGVKTDNVLRQSKEIGQPSPYEHTINIEGEGKVTGEPDIATLTLGTESKGVDVATAQQNNTTAMNKIVEGLKTLGIAEDDIQTSSYNVYENNEWNPETNTYTSKGWVVSNYVTVKVRDTSKISAVLKMAGDNAITNISGPTFTIDDPSNLKNEARIKALKQAKEKAEAVASSLGLKIEKVVGYSEWSPSTEPFYDYSSSFLSVASSESAAPTIQPGSNEVVVNVNITYKLVE